MGAWPLERSRSSCLLIRFLPSLLQSLLVSSGSRRSLDQRKGVKEKQAFHKVMKAFRIQ